MAQPTRGRGPRRGQRRRRLVPGERGQQRVARWRVHSSEGDLNAWQDASSVPVLGCRMPSCCARQNSSVHAPAHGRLPVASRSPVCAVERRRCLVDGMVQAEALTRSPAEMKPASRGDLFRRAPEPKTLATSKAAEQQSPNQSRRRGAVRGLAYKRYSFYRSGNITTLILSGANRTMKSRTKSGEYDRRPTASVDVSRTGGLGESYAAAGGLRSRGPLYPSIQLDLP